MSIKDLFGKTSPNLEETVQDVESVAFVEEKTKADQTYHPQIDFSDPENFVYYGSAELYYDAATIAASCASIVNTSVKTSQKPGPGGSSGIQMVSPGSSFILSSSLGLQEYILSAVAKSINALNRQIII